MGMVRVRYSGVAWPGRSWTLLIIGGASEPSILHREMSSRTSSRKRAAKVNTRSICWILLRGTAGLPANYGFARKDGIGAPVRRTNGMSTPPCTLCKGTATSRRTAFPGREPPRFGNSDYLVVKNEFTADGPGDGAAGAQKLCTIKQMPQREDEGQSHPETRGPEESRRDPLVLWSSG